MSAGKETQVCLLAALIEIQFHIQRGPAAGDDVGPAVAVEIGDDQVFRGDAAVIDDVFGPFVPVRRRQS